MSELLQREAMLRKVLDEERSLRLLCYEKEVELAHLWYEVSWSLNYVSYLKEQVVFFLSEIVPLLLAPETYILFILLAENM